MDRLSAPWTVVLAASFGACRADAPVEVDAPSRSTVVGVTAESVSDTGETDQQDDAGDTGDSGADDTGLPPPADADGDGAGEDVDCDDDDPTVYPGAVEACDGLDHDCDGSPECTEADAVIGISGAAGAFDLTTAGDYDGDGVDDIMLREEGTYGTGADYHWTGTHVVAGAALPGGTHPWTDLPNLTAGEDLVVLPVGDVDGDGRTDLSLLPFVPVDEYDSFGERDLGAWGIWLSDGRFDGRELTAESADLSTGSEVGVPWWTTVGDLDGDGADEVTLVTPATDSENRGCVFVSSPRLAQDDWTYADAPGFTDTEVGYAHRSPVGLGDLDGDGLPEVRVHDAHDHVHIVPGADLAAGRVPAVEAGFLVPGCPASESAPYLRAVGDVDGDATQDIALGCESQHEGGAPSSVIVAGAAALSITDPSVGMVSFEPGESGCIFGWEAGASTSVEGSDRPAVAIGYACASVGIYSAFVVYRGLAAGGVYGLADADVRVESSLGKRLISGYDDESGLGWLPDQTADGVAELLLFAYGSTDDDSEVLIFSGETLLR